LRALFDVKWILEIKNPVTFRPGEVNNQSSAVVCAAGSLYGVSGCGKPPDLLFLGEQTSTECGGMRKSKTISIYVYSTVD